MNNLKESYTEQVRKRWEPYDHCSNCKNCIVYNHLLVGEMVRCAKGHGPDKPLVKVIRIPYGRGWRKVVDCEDYESMD